MINIDGGSIDVRHCFCALFDMTPPPQLPGNRRPGRPIRPGQSTWSRPFAWPGQLGELDQLSNGHIYSIQAPLRPPSPRGDPILDPNDDNKLGTFFNGIASNQCSPPLLDNTLQFCEQWEYPAPNLLAHSTSYGPYIAPGLAEAGWPSLLDNCSFGQNDTAPTSLLEFPQSPQSSPLQQSRPQPQPLPFHYQPHLHPQPFHNNGNRSLHGNGYGRFHGNGNVSFHSNGNGSFHVNGNGNFHGNGNGSFHIPAEQDACENAAALLATMHSGHPNPRASPASSSNGLHPSPHMLSQRHGSNSHLPSYAPQTHHDSAQGMIIGRDEVSFTEMILGNSRSPVQPPPRPQALQWGSDHHFNRAQGFVPPQHESSEALENKRIAMTKEAFNLTSSTSNTRAPSPIGTWEAATHTIPKSRNDNIKVEVEENAATSPRKRRKSSAQIKGGFDRGRVLQIPSKAVARKRKTKGGQKGSSQPPSVMRATIRRRRRSVPSQPKLQRENLTEEQKREHHIISEQKRRGIIKEGFDDLTFIVPNLQNGGYSRSNVLNIAGEWLEKLMKGNQTLELKGQLAT